MRRPPALPNLGEMTEPKRLAFMTPWASPGGVSKHGGLAAGGDSVRQRTCDRDRPGAA